MAKITIVETIRTFFIAFVLYFIKTKIRSEISKKAAKYLLKNAKPKKSPESSA